MSLDYSLGLTTHLAPEEVAEEVVRAGQSLGILEESSTAQRLLVWSTTTRRTPERLALLPQPSTHRSHQYE